MERVTRLNIVGRRRGTKMVKMAAMPQHTTTGDGRAVAAAAATTTTPG